MQARSLDFHHHQRAVVRDGAPLGVLLHCFEHAVGQLSGRKLGALLKNRFQPARAEEFSFAIARLCKSVRIENKNVSLGKLDAPLVIGGIVKDADRESSELELFDVAILPEQGLRLPRIGDAKLVAPLLPSGKTDGHVPSINAAVADQLVQLAKKFRGLKFVRREAPKNTGGNGSVERRGAALAADVPERDAQLLRAVGKEIV